MNFIDRLELVLKQKNITKTELANKLNIRWPTLSEWAKNGSIPAADIALKIADYLNVSLEWLITGKEKENTITMEQKELLELCAKLTPEQSATIKTVIETMAKKMPPEGIVSDGVGQ